jgi:hypothetical protein
MIGHNFATVYNSVEGTTNIDNAQILAVSNQNIATSNGSISNDSRLLAFGGWNNGHSFIRNPAGSGMRFYIANVEAARFDSSFNFLINTTAAATGRLTVASPGGFPSISAVGNTTTTVTSDILITRTGATESSSVGTGPCIQIQNTTNNTAVMLQQYSNNFQIFRFSNSAWTESFRIDSSGNVGVNETNPSSSYSHGGTAMMLHISNTDTTINAQAHLMLASGVSSITQSSIGTISFVLPNISRTGTGRLANISGVTGSSHTSSTPQGYIYFAVKDTTDSTAIAKISIDPDGTLRSGYDNSRSCGSASYRWSVVYAGTGSINTSDENEKQDIVDIDQAEHNVAVALKSMMKRFRFKDAVAQKGDAARYHFGVVAQQVQQVFTDNGLDANQYGIFCEDTWWETTTTETVLDENSNPVLDAQGQPIVIDNRQVSKTAIDGWTQHTRLGIRYDELFALIISAL